MCSHFEFFFHSPGVYVYTPYSTTTTYKCSMMWEGNIHGFFFGGSSVEWSVLCCCLLGRKEGAAVYYKPKEDWALQGVQQEQSSLGSVAKIIWKVDWHKSCQEYFILLWCWWRKTNIINSRWWGGRLKDVKWNDFAGVPFKRRWWSWQPLEGEKIVQLLACRSILPYRQNEG